MNVMGEKWFSEVPIDFLKLVTFTTASIFNEKKVIENRFLERLLKEPCFRAIHSKRYLFQWAESEGRIFKNLTDTLKTLMTEIRTEVGGGKLEIFDVVQQIEDLLAQLDLKLNDYEPLYDIFNMIKTKTMHYNF